MILFMLHILKQYSENSVHRSHLIAKGFTAQKEESLLKIDLRKFKFMMLIM